MWNRERKSWTKEVYKGLAGGGVEQIDRQVTNYGFVAKSRGMGKQASQSLW